MIDGKSRVVSVWGCPIGHSRSPGMQNAAISALGLNWVYVPFEVSPDHVGEAVAGLRALNMVGANVTVPLKERVLPYLDVVDREAQRIGSVNTIVNREGVLYGSSTDGEGFIRALEGSGEKVHGRRALIIGAGGSARPIAFALAARAGELTVANRTASKAEDLVERVNRAYPGAAAVSRWGEKRNCEWDLIVNTTSLGMAPDESGMPPLPLGTNWSDVTVYDVIYAPAETRFLAEARARGARTLNGLSMLAQQGALSLSQWTGLPVERIPLQMMVQWLSSGLAENEGAAGK